MVKKRPQRFPRFDSMSRLRPINIGKDCSCCSAKATYKIRIIDNQDRNFSHFFVCLRHKSLAQDNLSNFYKHYEYHQEHLNYQIREEQLNDAAAAN